MQRLKNAERGWKGLTMQEWRSYVIDLACMLWWWYRHLDPNVHKHRRSQRSGTIGDFSSYSLIFAYFSCDFVTAWKFNWKGTRYFGCLFFRLIPLSPLIYFRGNGRWYILSQSGSRLDVLWLVVVKWAKLISFLSSWVKLDDISFSLQNTNIFLVRIFLNKIGWKESSLWASLTVYAELVATVNKTDETGTIFLNKCLTLSTFFFFFFAFN